MRGYEDQGGKETEQCFFSNPRKWQEMTIRGLDTTSNNRKSDRKSLDSEAGTHSSLYVFNNPQPGSDQIHSDTWNGTNRNGKFSDSNILHALTKSSGDRSCESRVKIHKAQRSGWHERAQAWMWASPPSLWHGWRDSKPPWAPSYPRAPEREGRGRSKATNVTKRKVEFSVWS